jgi:hypothetical protein
MKQIATVEPVEKLATKSIYPCSAVRLPEVKCFHLGAARWQHPCQLGTV